MCGTRESASFELQPELFKPPRVTGQSSPDGGQRIHKAGKSELYQVRILATRCAANVLLLLMGDGALRRILIGGTGSCQAATAGVRSRSCCRAIMFLSCSEFQGA